MLSFCLREYRYDASVFAALAEVYDSVCKSVKSIILTDTYIGARVNVCSSLTVKDVACENELSVCSLSTETL